MTDLLPCPFCGCRVPPAVQGNGIGDNWLECTDCGASTRLREDGAGSEKDWNRRATPADQEPVGYFEFDTACKTWDEVDENFKDDKGIVPLFAAPQPPQNAADHIVDANKKVEANSVPVAKVGPGIGMMAHCIRWTDMEAMDRLPIGTVLYAQAPQPEAQSVRDAWISVDDQLPEKNLVVLCGADFYAPGDWRMKLGYFDGPTSVWKLFSGSWTPTHWQPLPAPPQKPVSDEVKP